MRCCFLRRATAAGQSTSRQSQTGRNAAAFARSNGGPHRLPPKNKEGRLLWARHCRRLHHIPRSRDYVAPTAQPRCRGSCAGCQDCSGGGRGSPFLHRQAAPTCETQQKGTCMTRRSPSTRSATLARPRSPASAPRAGFWCAIAMTMVGSPRERWNGRRCSTSCETFRPILSMSLSYKIDRLSRSLMDFAKSLTRNAIKSISVTVVSAGAVMRGRGGGTSA